MLEDDDTAALLLADGVEDDEAAAASAAADGVEDDEAAAPAGGTVRPRLVRAVADGAVMSDAAAG